MNIPLIKPDLPGVQDIWHELDSILENGQITNFSRYVSEFEQETSEYLNTSTLTVSSGTMGLLFALLALGLKPGQKVILPSFTFMATAQAILLAGGIPVFAEIEDDMTISPADLATLLAETSNVGAIIAVHMYGLPAKIAEISRVVAEAGNSVGRHIPVLYDAAHAFGASAGGARVGGFGDVEVFSLSVTKMLVAVEGGLISTARADVIERIRQMRNYGIHSDYNACLPGMNGKMSEFHAIVGLYNLRRLDSLLAQRQVKANCYRKRIHQATPFPVVDWPDNVIHTFKDFTIRIPDTCSYDVRDRVCAFLSARGISTRCYFYPPVHEQTLFRQFATRPLPVTSDLSRRVITLPFYTSMTSGEMDYVVDALRCAGAEVS